MIEYVYDKTPMTSLTTTQYELESHHSRSHRPLYHIELEKLTEIRAAVTYYCSKFVYAFASPAVTCLHSLKCFFPAAYFSRPWSRTLAHNTGLQTWVRVKVNCQAEWLRQSSFWSNAIVRKHTQRHAHTDTHTVDRLHYSATKAVSEPLSQLKSCQLLHNCTKNHIWLEGLPFHVVQKYRDRFFELVTKHACDRRTDGRTDGQTDRITTPKTALA